MPEVGRGEVVIVPDLSRFGRDLDRAIGPHLQRAAKEMESDFGASAKKAAASVDAAFAKTKSGIYVPIHADTKGFGAELDREVDPLVARVDADVPVGADTSGFGSDLKSGVGRHLSPVDVPVHPDASGFRRLPDDLRPHVKRASDDMERTFTASAGRAGKALTGALGVGIGAALGKELLDLGNQVATFRIKTKTVFEDSTDDVERWAKENGKALGLTETRLAGVAANFGDLLKPMGFTADKAAEMSTTVIGLAGALSAWSGGTRSVVDVSETLSKAMLGEREELKGLGISITEADVQTRLLAKGQGELAGAAEQQAKAIATQELIFEKSTDAQKAWADGSFDAIKKQNELRAKVGELKEELAVGLLPAFQGVAAVLTAIPEPLIKVAAGLGAVVAVAVGVNKTVGAIKELPNPLNLASSSATSTAGSLLRVAGTAAALGGVVLAGKAIGDAMSRTKVDVENLATATGDELVAAFRKAQQFGAEDKAFGAVLKTSISEAERLVDALDAAGIETGKYRKQIDDTIGAQKAVAVAKEKDAQVTGDLTDSTKELWPQVRRSKEEMEALAGAVDAAFQASQSLIGSQLSVADATASLRDAAIDARLKEDELAAAIRNHGRASAEAHMAGRALDEARRAQLGDIDSLAQAQVRLAEQQGIAAGKALTDADKYRLYRDELIKVKDTLAPEAPLRKHLEGLINQLPPPVIKSQVVLDTTSWEAQMAKLRPIMESFGVPARFMPKMHGGGEVSGVGREMPALLERGEFVVQKSAVDVLGVSTLEALNKMHAGGLVPGAVAPIAGRIDMDVEPLSAMTSGPLAGGVTFGNINVTGVRDGEDAAILLPTRIRTELFLMGAG